jgi:hypothetical protein
VRGTSGQPKGVSGTSRNKTLIAPVGTKSKGTKGMGGTIENAKDLAAINKSLKYNY